MSIEAKWFLNGFHLLCFGRVSSAHPTWDVA
jgi:hypothetical protein